MDTAWYAVAGACFGYDLTLAGTLWAIDRNHPCNPWTILEMAPRFRTMVILQ